MLNEAVNELKGIANDNLFETTVDINVDAFIPATYIRSELQKLDVYKRIAGIETSEELMDMQDELIDRFGELPKSAINLLNIALIKSIAHSFGAIEVKGGVAGSNWSTVIKIYPKAQINSENIPKLINEYNGELRFTTDKEPFFSYTISKKKCKDAQEYLNILKDLLNKLSQELKIITNS